MFSIMSNFVAGKCKLRELNEMITCKMCHGYLVEATAVTECFHTFCKSCIVKHLEDNKTCPECENIIHQSHPLDYLAYDRTLQDLVYKIVPGLEDSERQRERAFYKERGLTCPKTLLQHQDFNSDINVLKDAHSEISKLEEMIYFTVESKGHSKSKTDQTRKIVRCQSVATVKHVKGFVTKNILPHTEVSKLNILCRGERLMDHHTLRFAYFTKWTPNSGPLSLQYEVV